MEPLTDIPLALHPENWQIFRPDGQPFAPHELPLWRAIVDGETSKNVDVVIRRSDGEQRWVLSNAAPVRDAEGRIVAGVAVFPDVSERRRMDAALHRANQALASHMNNSPLAMIEWDSDWRIRRWSRQAERIFGWKEPEVLGKHWKDVELVSDEDMPVLSGVAGRLSDGTEADNISYNRNRTRTGQVIHCEWYNSVLRDDSGRSLSILSLVHDVTQRRRAEEDKARLAEQLRQVQKMEALGQLAGGVAHDFNNLLTAISGNVEILEELLRRLRSQTGADARRALGQIRSAGQRGGALTRQLLAFGRKEIVHSEVIAPATIVAEMEEMLRRLIGANIDLQVVCNGESGWVIAGSGQIQQIILNLVVNASDAMPRGGQLRIELGCADLAAVQPDARAVPRTGRYVVLAVSDTGTGMSAETQARIFEPFFTTKPVGKGTGLGLSTVYGAVTGLGGHLQVDSAPGRGSRFSIFLPAVEAPAATPAPRRRTRAGGRGEVVLVCEDEEMVRDVTCRLLRKGGYTVLAAENGHAALRLMEDNPGHVDLLISDVVMPDMNGRELAEALCARQPDMAVLYVSGYTADVIDDHGLDEDGAEFLYKPFAPRELLARVRQLLDRE
jgi:PAS domain S-box-containing protein